MMQQFKEWWRSKLIWLTGILVIAAPVIWDYIQSNLNADVFMSGKALYSLLVGVVLIIVRVKSSGAKIGTATEVRTQVPDAKD